MKSIKIFGFIILLAAFCSVFATAAEMTLTINGDGVEREIVYSRTELEAMTDVTESHSYSAANNFPTEKNEDAEGVPLMYLLKQAGIKDNAQLITVTARDGYKRVFTLHELLEEPRYYFPAEGEKKAVPALVCLKSGSGNLEEIEPKLVMGQRVRGEQNNPWFVRYLSEITVSCETPEKWPEVTFNRVAGPDGITLTLLHKNIDSVKIYYTTDGSEPTLNSNVYNVSATYYQPQLNRPLLLDKSTVVRAIAIGAGKENSGISSITISFDDTAFSDIAGYEWAKQAIEALAADGIVTGTGNSRFEPGGSLTRAMFVTMLSRALNVESTQIGTERLFADVDYNSWYGAHVQWAVERGIVTGYPDGSFKPDTPLTVEEMIVMAVRAGGIETAESGTGIALNKNGVSEWARPYVVAAEMNELLEKGHMSAETPEGLMVEGRKQAARAEAAVILYKLLSLLTGSM